MQYVTIKDIARALNVSVATVSRAFNDKYDIKKETRELILEKARELGYKPNPIARKLLQKHSYNVGVIVPEFINSFFPEVIIGIQQVFLEKGYQVIIMQSNESAETELENLISMENNMVEGLLISLSKDTRNMDYLEQLNRDRFPVVLFNRVNETLPVSKVVFNDYKWALFATEHLIEQGYKKIFHLSAPRCLTLSKNRINGFKKALEKHRLPCSEAQIIETGILIEDGERVMEQLISSGNVPEAIFATNDPCALGAMKALKKHGYKIPGDIGIVGFSNSKMTEIVEPSLTSVAQPTTEMGKIAARLLLEQITGTGNADPKTILMEGSLIVRNSSIREKQS
ncbi:LacI family DNA-binding transcriptional regulator [Compostibacter hankyongensis]|uniref:LacI family DNA-binding transcriptional regulator n=1 Tax=Compostibacter hankyongensis TaxID=1007089 RepID=A0ABP8FGZ6_9BACT